MDAKDDDSRERGAGGTSAPAHVETRTLLDPSDAARARRVDWHLACSACGYDLFELDREGVCPECGTPVAMSTRGWLLRDLGAGVARSYARAAGLAAIGTLLVPVLGLVMVLVDGARQSSRSGASGVLAAVELGLGAALLGAMACWLAGWWGLARSRDHAAWRGPGGARTARVWLVDGVVRGCSGAMLIGLVGVYVSGPVLMSDRAMLVAIIVTLLSLAGMLVAAPSVVRRLAGGLPVTRVAGGARVLQVFGIVLVVLNSICLPTMILPLMLSLNLVSGLVYFSVLIACLVDLSALARREAFLAAGRAAGWGERAA